MGRGKGGEGPMSLSPPSPLKLNPAYALATKGHRLFEEKKCTPRENPGYAYGCLLIFYVYLLFK